jgi:hypothetical protein
MADTKRLITIQRVAANGTDYDIYYPRTVASQVYYDETNNLTVADHITDTAQIHLTAAERTALTNYNQASGFAKVEATGYLPNSIINPSVLAITTEFANIAAMLASTDVPAGQLVWVTDASGDTTVTSGWAVYRKKVGTGIDYTTLTGWQKVAEAESLDVVVSWDNIQGKPSSTPAEIDQAVADDHTHSNKAALDDLADATTGTAPDQVIGLTYKGRALAFDDQVTTFTFVASGQTVPAASTLDVGDFVFVEA